MMQNEEKEFRSVINELCEIDFIGCLKKMTSAVDAIHPGFRCGVVFRTIFNVFLCWSLTRQQLLDQVCR